MQISPFDASMAAQVAQAYDRAVEGVPHCYPVTADEFAAATGSTEDAHASAPLRAQSTLVATLGGSVVALATAAVAPCDDGDAGERGLIRFIWYERRNRQAGRALLETVEEHLLAHNVRTITAFDQDFRFPIYHLRFGCLTDRWDHVHGLLGMRGYERAKQEVFLDWQNLDPPDPGLSPVPVEVRVEPPSGKGWAPTTGRGARPGLVVTAWQGGERVGTCACSCAGEFSRNADAQDWLFTEWLGVEDRLQGQGLGKYLLIRALNEARSLGYRHAAISTLLTNHRALLFYSNLGYRAVDWTTLFRRDAGDGPV